jgi:SAM-dependent methyltransferase
MKGKLEMHHCRLCDCQIDMESSIEIDVPAGTQLFSDDRHTSLSLSTSIKILECPNCELIQLFGDPVVYEDFSSSSSFVSEQLTQHRISQLQALLALRPNLRNLGAILEVGCGDGHLLVNASHMFTNSVGIEPTRRNVISAQAKSLPVQQLFMNEDTIVNGSPFEYFCSFHVFEHVPQIGPFLRGLKKNLSPDAVGVIEVPSTEAAISNLRFGDFMPDHLSYFTKHTLRKALEWNGFSVKDIYSDWGGEHLVAYVQKRPTKPSSLSYISKRSEDLYDFVRTVNASGVTLAVWGISHHLMPYIKILLLVKKLIPIDTSEAKIGKFIPSTSLKVMPTSELSGRDHLYVAITAPRFRHEITVSLSLKYESIKLAQELSEQLGFEVFECRSSKNGES